MSDHLDKPTKWCCPWCKKELSMKYARADHMKRCDMYLRTINLHDELKQEMLHEFKLFLQELKSDLKQELANQKHVVNRKQTPPIF